MKLKLQSGSIRKKNGAWHWRYYEDGKQKEVKLADISDEFRSEKDVIPIANGMAVRQPSNGPRSGNVAIVDFAENVFLPWVKAERRAATHNGYKILWKGRLKKHFAERRLFDYQPYHATEFLTALAKEGIGRYAVSHFRALMSGIFAHAVALGYLRVNPIHDCKVLVKPKEPAEGQHYTIEEMKAILAALRGEPQALVAMSLAFVGLNRAEIRGVKWEDVDTDNGIIHVRRSVWGKDIVSEGGKSKKRVPGRFNRAVALQHPRAIPESGAIILVSEASSFGCTGLPVRCLDERICYDRLADAAIGENLIERFLIKDGAARFRIG